MFRTLVKPAARAVDVSQIPGRPRVDGLSAASASLEARLDLRAQFLPQSLVVCAVAALSGGGLRHEPLSARLSSDLD